MSFLFAASGVSFAISWFVFFDGFVIASREGFADGDTSVYYDAEPYTFVMFVPGLLALLALCVLMCVKPEHVINQESDESVELIGGGGAFGGEEESAVIRSKILFCISFFVFFAALGVGIWKLIDPYAKVSTQVTIQNTTTTIAPALSHSDDASSVVGFYANHVLDQVKRALPDTLNNNNKAATTTSEMLLGNSYNRTEKINVWPGIAVVVQVTLIIMSAVMCLLGRRKTHEDSLLFY